MYINGPGKQSEGDTKTPLGTWTIGEAYGINDDPGSRVPYTKVDDDMYWCATGSIGYNRAGAPYAGNAIFLHCWRGEDKPKGGCVAVSENDMIKILQTVTPGTSVTIY